MLLSWLWLLPLVAKKKPRLLLPLRLLPLLRLLNRSLLKLLRLLPLLLRLLPLLLRLLLRLRLPSNRFCDLGTASAVTKNRPSRPVFLCFDS